MPPPDGRIRTLDAHVANQIAAGEVVERPSSVVKELIENAVDAGATRVEIHLVDGGRSQIRIVDDGHGMGPTDARAAFVRHATSKLTDADELMRIGSYGFRGEALASILSIARVTLLTRRSQDELGTRVTGAGDAALSVAPSVAPVGTDLTIADLFFNVPARQKFLRTAATELGHVIRLVDAVALARTGLTLLLTHNGRQIADYPATESLAERAAQVFEPEVGEALFPVTGHGPYRVDGMLSGPALHRGSASGLILLVDGRPVQDTTLRHAVSQAYGELLERRRFPVGVLRLWCPPGTVDANVHPAKTEVRFVSRQAVHRAVGEAIRAMLAPAPWQIGEPAAPYRASPPAGTSQEPARPLELVPPPRGRTSHHLRDVAPGLSPRARPASGAARIDSGAAVASGRSPSAPARPRTSAGPFVPAEAPPGPAAGHEGGRCRLLGVVADRWVVAEEGSALLLLDGAALVTADRPPRRLMFPQVVPLGPEAAALLLTRLDELASLGLDLAAAGPRAVVVRAVPGGVSDAGVASAVRSLAASLGEGSDAPLSAAVARMVSRVDAARAQAILDELPSHRRARPAAIRRLDDRALIALFGG